MTMIRRCSLIPGLVLAATLTLGVAAQQTPTAPALHAVAHKRLVIENAIVIYGNAKPTYGPVDIVIEDGLIAYVGTASDRGAQGRSRSTGPDAVIDATGKYVMPGTSTRLCTGTRNASRASCSRFTIDD